MSTQRRRRNAAAPDRSLQLRSGSRSSGLRVDLDQILLAGGARRIAFLRFCVLSVRMAPIFGFLVGEFRLRPTHAGALALYDVFCAPDAPARLPLEIGLPPHDLRLSATIAALRRQWESMQREDAESVVQPVGICTPMRNLFDGVLGALRSTPAGDLRRLATLYDPAREPVENLPGGKITPGQRMFVDHSWKPRIRPRLVAAGFWRVDVIE